MSAIQVNTSPVSFTAATIAESKMTVCDYLKALIERIKGFVFEYITTPLLNWWYGSTVLQINSEFLNSHQFSVLKNIEPKLAEGLNARYVQYLNNKFREGTCNGEALATLKQAPTVRNWTENPPQDSLACRCDAIFFQTLFYLERDVEVLILLDQKLESLGRTFKDFIDAEGDIIKPPLLNYLKQTLPHNPVKVLEAFIERTTAEDLELGPKQLKEKLASIQNARKTALETAKSALYTSREVTQIAAPAETSQKVNDYFQNKKGNFVLSISRKQQDSHSVFIRLDPQESLMFNPADKKWTRYATAASCVRDTVQIFTDVLPATENWWDVDELESAPT
jgi:hypothetical protein